MGSYRVSQLALVALAVVALGGCARDATSPGGATKAPRFSTEASGSSYIVLFKGSGIPDDFTASIQALGGSVRFAHAGAGLAVVDGLTDVAAATVAASKDVAEVDPNVMVALSPGRSRHASVGSLNLGSAPPTPALGYAWQWNMRDINADKAWTAGKTGNGVTVAILDTGIDYDAPDLIGVVDLARSISFTPADDAIRAQFAPTREPFDDFLGHGTNVATQVATNHFVFAGVGSQTKLWAVKVLGANGSGDMGNVLGGLLFAADSGADVANLSLGLLFDKRRAGWFVGNALSRVFSVAYRKGMLVVASAGNESLDLDHDVFLMAGICEAPHVVCVSAVGPVLATELDTPAQDALAWYSNYGRSAVSVAAPGGNYTPPGGEASDWPWFPDVASWVWSYCAKYSLLTDANGHLVQPLQLVGCQAGNGLTAMIGTSQAAPHVSGLAALLVAEIGHDKPAQVKAAILKSADDLGQPGVDPFYGAGRINVAKALGL